MCIHNQNQYTSHGNTFDHPLNTEELHPNPTETCYWVYSAFIFRKGLKKLLNFLGVGPYYRNGRSINLSLSYTLVVVVVRRVVKSHRNLSKLIQTHTRKHTHTHTHTHKHTLICVSSHTYTHTHTHTHTHTPTHTLTLTHTYSELWY